MQLSLGDPLALGLKSNAQRIRVLSESWAQSNLFCPRCGGTLTKLSNNAPVADFSCPCCPEEFELKSTSGRACSAIPDGAYETMLRRLRANNNPNLFVLRYDRASLQVRDAIVVPRYYFTPDLIRKRPPLAPTARRAGWVGCTIHLGGIPQRGRITLLEQGTAATPETVMKAWREASFLERVGSLHARGWLLSVLGCIERIAKPEFTLAQLYVFEYELRQRHPGNLHIREKLRQQLQVLRDRGVIRFVGRGRYAVAPSS